MQVRSEDNRGTDEERPVTGAGTIQVAPGVEISTEQLTFRASRSSGPGGQNVNKVSSRVSVLLDVANCPSFSEHQRRRILKRLGRRVGRDGVLRVTSQRFRTQKANRRRATERLAELLSDALQPRPIRKKTTVPLRARQQRLADKKHRSMLKKQRSTLE